MNEIFSRDYLNNRYFGGPSWGAMGNKYIDYSYHIDIILEFKPNKVRRIPFPQKVCIGFKGMEGYTIDKKSDRRHFCEFIFLLAAKLKYDLWERHWSYDGSGFLHTKEIINLNNSGVTRVARTTYDAVRELYDAARDSHYFLNRFLIHRDQLWHLICRYGSTGTTSESFGLIWWLNVPEEDISFKDVNGDDIPEDILKKLFKGFFKGCLLGLPELMKYNETVIEEIALKKGYAQKERKDTTDKIVSIVKQEGQSHGGKTQELFTLKRDSQLVQQILGFEIPDSPHDRETWIWRLFKRIWRDENAKRNARNQHGLDIFGKDSERPGFWIGVQCRLLGIGNILNLEDLQKEINDARRFPNSLSHVIIVTAVPQNLQVREQISRISSEHKTQGLFEIELLTWDEIKRKLWQFQDLWREYVEGIRGAKIYPPIESTYDIDIIQKHKTIIGRRQLKERVHNFIADNDRGMLLITGTAGIGKTALMANLVNELSIIGEGKSVFSFFFSWESPRFSLHSCWRSLYWAIAKKSGYLIEPPASEIKVLALQFSDLLQKTVSESDTVGTDQSYKNYVSGLQENEGQIVVSKANPCHIFIIDAIDEAEDAVLFLRLLPKPLPPRTFFILSSRPGSHLDGFAAFSGTDSIITIDPQKEENVSDAYTFAKEQFPKWSITVLKKIIARANSNFLFLKRFSDFVKSESIDDANASDWCEEFGATENDPLYALYERYWVYLHGKCSESKHSEDSDDMNELSGLLAIVYSPISLPIIRRILGEKWTTARFERIFQYIRQFIDIKSYIYETQHAREKVYSFSHPTFRRFISKKLSSDLPMLHRRIVDSYCKTDGGQIDLSSLDEYGINFIIRHALFSVDSSCALALFTHEFMKYKISSVKYIPSVIEDLSVLIQASEQSQDFCSLFKYSFVQKTLLDSHKRKTKGIEAVLYARVGDIEGAISEVNSFGNVDDEILVRAELVQKYWNQNSQYSMDQLMKIDLLSSTCSSEFDSGKNNVSPDVLEAVICKVAQVNPAAGLRLAASIPEPMIIIDALTMFEKPNWGRAVWLIITIVIRKSTCDIEELINTAEDDFQRSFIWMTFGVQMFAKDPVIAVEAITKATTYENNENDKAYLALFIFRYCLWHLPNLAPHVAAKSLNALVQLELLRTDCPEYAMVIDHCIEKEPITWSNVVCEMDDGSAKDIINWRLYELGHSSNIEIGKYKDEKIRDLIQGVNIGMLASSDIIAAAKAADNLCGLWGYAKAVAGIIKLVAQNDKNQAANLAEMFFDSEKVEADFEGFWATLEILKVIVHWSSDIRCRIITWCSNIAPKMEPESFRKDADLALNHLLASAVTAAVPNESAYFREIIQNIGSETGREVLAMRIIEELPESVCLGFSRDLVSYGVVTSEFDPLNPTQHSLFLPETIVCLLSSLSWRISSVDIEKAKELLYQTIRICVSIEDESDRENAIEKVLRVAFRLSPGLALNVFQICPCSQWRFQWVINRVLLELLETPKDQMSKNLRFEWEWKTALELRQNADDIYWKKRYYEARQISVPSLGMSLCKAMTLSHEWLNELPEYFQKYIKIFNLKKYDLQGMDKILNNVMSLDWPTFRSLILNPEVGQCLCEHVRIHELLLYISKSELPIDQLSENIRFVLSALKGKDDALSISNLKVYVVAAAASVDPQLCISMMRSLPWNSQCSFLEHLEFIPKAHWSETYLLELFHILDEAIPKKDSVKAKAKFLNWLHTKVDISEKNLNTIINESVELNDAWDINEIAKYLEVYGCGLRDRLAQEALACAAEKCDARTIVTVLEAHPSFPISNSMQLLATAREIDAVTEESWLLYRIVMLQAKMNIDEAVHTLSLMKINDSDIDKALDAIAEVAAQISENNMNIWIDRIKVLPNLTEQHRDRFIRLLLTRRLECGMAISKEYIGTLSNLNDWVELYLRAYKPNNEKEMIVFEAALDTRITASVSHDDRQRAFCIVGYYYANFAQEKAVYFYKRAMQEMSKLSEQTLFVIYIDRLVEKCMELPQKYAYNLTDELYITVKNRLRNRSHMFYLSDKAASLVCVSVSFWPFDQKMAKTVLKEVSQLLCHNWELSTLGLVVFEIEKWFNHLVKHYGFPATAGWIHSCIEAFPKKHQQDVIDNICSKLCDASEEEDDMPLVMIGVFQKRLNEYQCMMLRELFPGCSDALKARCNFIFAITYWGKDRHRVTAEINLAVSSIGKISDQLKIRDRDNIWLTYAAANGYEGMVKALCAFAQTDSLDRNMEYLLYLIVTYDNARELIEQAWKALESSGQYVM